MSEVAEPAVENKPAPKPVVMTLKDAGAIIESEIKIVPGAVTELVGRNGIGKTTAQKAIKSVLKKGSEKVLPRDGVDAGSLEMPGVRVRIGQRLSMKGDPGEIFVMIEDGEELRQLVDPGIDKAASADAKRIEALLRMVKANVSEDVFREFVGADDWKDFKATVDIAKDGPVEIVAKVKRWLESRARTAEVQVEQASGAIAHIGELPEETAEAVDRKALEDRRTDLIIQIRSAEDEIVNAKSAVQRLNQLAEVTGSVEECDQQIHEIELQLSLDARKIDGIKANAISDRNRLVAERDEKLEAIRKDYERQILQIGTAHQNNLSEIEKAVAADQQRVENLKATRQRIEEFHKTLESLRAESKTEWTEEKIHDLQKERDALTQQITDAVRFEEQMKGLENKRAELKAATLRKMEAEKRAEHYRGLADKIPVILSNAVKSLPGWSITNHNGEMRLMCEHARGVICFDQFSPGEAVAKGLEATCRPHDSNGRIPIASIDAELWATLDADNKEIVLKLLAESGMSLLTSRCSERGEPRELHTKILKAGDVAETAEAEASVEA